LGCLDISDVRHPDLIRARGYGLAQPIGSDGQIVVAVCGGGLKARFLRAAQILLAHEAGDAISTVTLPVAGRCGGSHRSPHVPGKLRRSASAGRPPPKRAGLARLGVDSSCNTRCGRLQNSRTAFARSAPLSFRECVRSVRRGFGEDAQLFLECPAVDAVVRSRAAKQPVRLLNLPGC
jgi:hypothetical protein